MPSIPISKRLAAIEQLNSGSSERDVAKNLKISKTAVHSIWKKYLTYGTIEDLPRPGRPCKCTARDKRRIVSQVNKDPTLTSREIAENYNIAQPPSKKLSAPFIRQVLLEKGIRARRHPIKWAIKPENKVKRVQWAQKFLSLTIED